MFSKLLAGLDGLTASVRRVGSVNVNDKILKGQAIELAMYYFNETRPGLSKILGEAKTLNEHDKDCQYLVRLAPRNNVRTSIASVLARGWRMHPRLHFCAYREIYPRADVVRASYRREVT